MLKKHYRGIAGVFNSGDTGVIQGYYRGFIEYYMWVTYVFQECYRGPTVVLERWYRGVTRVVQGYYSCVTEVLGDVAGCVPSVLQGYYRMLELHDFVSGVIGCYMSGTGLLQGCHRVILWCFWGVKAVLQGCYRDLTWGLLGCYIDIPIPNSPTKKSG